MTDKRFTTNGYYIYDHFKEDKWLVNEVEAEEIVTIMNNLDTKARERSKALSKLQKENERLKKELYRVYDDDYYLKQFIMAIVTVFSSGNNGLSKGRYELIVDACEMNKTSLKEFFK